MGKRKYSDEFRAQAIRLARTSGQSIRQVAADLGVSNETLGQWLREEAAAAAGTGQLNAAERTELAELRKENARLRMERDLLKRATAFWVKESGQ